MMGREKWGALCLATLIAAAGIVLASSTYRQVPHKLSGKMEEASARTLVAFREIKEERLRRNLPVDPALDPNLTGLIGWDYSSITTTLGALESKRSTTNPNMAALAVRLYEEAGLKAGDRVAFNLSGSFPAMNIAALLAADTMGLDTVSISSAGASTYGANIPQFTWVDMEHHLASRGMLPSPSVAVSLGGRDDLGLEFPLEVREELVSRFREMGYEVVSVPGLEENIRQRAAWYGPVDAFVNVGGNLLSFGGQTGNLPRYGVIKGLSPAPLQSGLVPYYAGQGIPVVHLLNMKGLLAGYGLPYDPVPLPDPGEGAVYTIRKLPFASRATGAALACLSLSILYYAFRKRPASRNPLEPSSHV